MQTNLRSISSSRVGGTLPSLLLGRRLPAQRQRIVANENAPIQGRQAPHAPGAERRAVLLSIIATGVCCRQARAEEGLPKAYRTVVEKIVSSLREALDAEVFEASEAAVRRKADPAKENIRQFVSRWRGDPKVEDHPSHDEILAVIGELSRFYAKAGARARMTDETRNAIYAHLDAAEASLAVAPRASYSAPDGLAGLFPSS